MKRIRFYIAASLLLLGAACAATNPDGTKPSPYQQALTSATTSYNALDAAIVAADAAVKAGTLKGQDARNALKGLTDAKAGLDVALVTLRAANAATVPAPAASGAKP